MIAAIDPGKRGGICIIDEFNRVSTISLGRPMLQVLGDLRKANVDHVYIEDVRLISPGKKATSALSEQIGIFIGFCIIYGINYTFVHPKTWQKHYGLVKCTQKRFEKDECDCVDTDRTWKQKLFNVAQELSPIELTLDTCDAFLIAYSFKI